jgi:hypothetical protein
MLCMVAPSSGSETTSKGTTFFRGRINKLILETTWTHHTFRTTGIFKHCLTTNKKKCTFCSTEDIHLVALLHNTFSSKKKLLCLESYKPPWAPTTCLNFTGTVTNCVGQRAAMTIYSKQHAHRLERHPLHLHLHLLMVFMNDTLFWNEIWEVYKNVWEK